MMESTGFIMTYPMYKHSVKYARTGGTMVSNTLVKIVNEGIAIGVDEKGEVSSHTKFGWRR
jgi:4-coumarate--CoA ligase